MQLFLLLFILVNLFNINKLIIKICGLTVICPINTSVNDPIAETFDSASWGLHFNYIFFSSISDAFKNWLSYALFNDALKKSLILLKLWFVRKISNGIKYNMLLPRQYK